MLWSAHKGLTHGLQVIVECGSGLYALTGAGGVECGSALWSAHKGLTHMAAVRAVISP